MIYRLRYCNKDGVEARVDIQKGSSTPVIEVEGTERPFILSYNNDKGNKSGMFLSSSADIEIYETPDFNIDNLKTSNETELSVTHYINNVVSWQGFIIPDFFSIEVRNNPVITMTASDRLGTLKNVTLADLPSMISLRELAILCLNKTGLELPLRTMADFNNGTGINDFFNSKILTQRLSDTKGRSISCYDILSSILTASNSFLVQRSGGWHIINKIQHEAGSGKLYTGATSFINWSDVIFNFSDISIGGRRTIIPVASTVGVFHEFGGGRIYPENYDFSLDLTGWTSVNGFVAVIDNRKVDNFVSGTGVIPQEWTTDPVFGEPTEKKYLVNDNYGINYDFADKPYLRSSNIPVTYPNISQVKVNVEVNATGPYIDNETYRGETNFAVIASNGTSTLHLTGSGTFEPLSGDPFLHKVLFDGDTHLQAVTSSRSVNGVLAVQEGNLSGYYITVRIYGYTKGVTGGRFLVTTLVNSVAVTITDISYEAKGTLYKTERTDNYTKAHDIDTSLFADYLTTGLNGYFYNFPIDDTSLIYNSNNELTSKWTAYNDPEQLPLLQHITRQKSRLFSVAHDLLSAEIEASNFDPLAIFVACEKRYTVVSAQFDFFKSNLSAELEEVAFQNATVRDFIYSYFGDGESGIKSIGGISGGGGVSTGGGLTPEQLEVLSFWKKDPDNPNTIFTEMNAYSKLELSAYGAGDSGGGGGDFKRLDVWADYDSSKAEWVLSAFLGNDLNTRVTNLENNAGSGSVTSVGISVPTGLSVSNSPITSSGVIEIGLQAGYSIPTTVKQGQWDTAFTNSHTHSNKTVLDGITSALVSNWNTAFTNTHTHANKTVLDGITSSLVSDWNTAFTNNHTHSNKTQLDLITQSNIDVLARLSIVNGNLQIDGNAYATGELSAYGAGDGGGGGGGIIETVYGYSNLGQTFNNNILTDTFNAYTINQINTRLVSVENGSATTVNTTGTGNAITSISKAGTVITANKDLTFSLSNHLHTGVYVPTSRTITAGNGLAGGGALSANQTITLGTPGTLTATTTNALQTESHTHSITTTSVGAVNTIVQTNTNGAIGTSRYGTFGTYSPAQTQGIWSIGSDYTVYSNVTSLGGLYGLAYSYISVGGSSVDSRHQIHFAEAGVAKVSVNMTDASVKATTFIGALSGNAATATKLQTARTIAGVSFDGTANIAIPFANLSSKPTTLSGYGITDAVNNYGAQTIDGSKTFIAKMYLDRNNVNNTIGFRNNGINTVSFGYEFNKKGLTFYNFASTKDLFIADNGDFIYATDRFVVKNNTYVGVGTPSPSEKLHVVGNILATGTTTTTKVIFNSAGWSMEQVGSELQMKHNNLIAARFLSDGSIVGLGEITAYGEATGGEGVSLLRTGGTMTGNLTMSADIIMNGDIIMNSGRAIGVSNLPLKLLGNALTYNASNVLTEANTATQIKMGNGWTIEQTVASLTIRKDGVIKGTFNA